MESLTAMPAEKKPQEDLRELMSGQRWILESLSNNKLSLTFKQLEIRHRFTDEKLRAHLKGLKRGNLVKVKDGRVAITDKGRELLRKNIPEL